MGNAALASALPSLASSELETLRIPVGASDITITGRMSVQGTGEFGETLRLTLAVAGTICASSITPPDRIIALADGTTGTLSITAPESGKWTATSVEPWVGFTPSSGTGSARVSYSVRQNVGPMRQGSVTIAGHPLTVVQAAAKPVFASPPDVSPTSLDFGSLALGAAGPAQTVTVRNSGTLSLTLSGIGIGGANGGDFEQSNTCGSTLAAGASCRIAVRFAPSRAGLRAGLLFIAANTGAGASAIGLSGVGMATGASKPVIQGVADVWNYSAGVAPGLWVAIAGSNLSPFAQIADFGARDTLPTELGSVRVTFNGAPAALSYAGPTQINALAPKSIEPGPVNVIVEADGVASDAFAVTAKTTQPAIYAIPDVDGAVYSVTAALPGTGFLVGNRAVDARVNRGAFPGETIDLYMLGMGATLDPAGFVTDRVFAAAYPIAAPATARVGGLPARVIFAGLTSPGLYLVRMEVPPDVSPGNQPIEVSVGEAPVSTTAPRLSLIVESRPAGLKTRP